MIRRILVHHADPILSSEVGKCPLGNHFICVSESSRVVEGVAQEVTVEAVAGEWHFDSGASDDAVWVVDVGIIRENFRDVEAKDFTNVCEV